ncbi:putative protein of unknown function (DUF4586) [Blattamonas nauphoetae]|uniref:Cilia-and flagella-associated protein 96 n=1 Tax=Blattamonas nauphoetae TaxID=2049346 RepID=A0ABQ9Y6H3_9EUKA|nr:putative protein of unknown function (DUF4586) [Blattamonas nauphoetae]
MSRSPSNTQSLNRTSKSLGAEDLSFSPYLNVGEPYVDNPERALLDDRFKGKQFEMRSQKKGMTDDTLISPMLPLAVGEPYNPEGKPTKKEKKGKPISEKPFISNSSPMRGALASFSRPEYVPEPQSVKPRSQSPNTTTKRGFFTSPPKKGGSGYAHTLIGGDEYEYMPDPYGGDRKKVEKMKPKTPAIPFRNVSVARPPYDITFFQPYNTQPAASRAERRKRMKKQNQNEFKPREPFKPSSGRKSGVFGTINPFPEYIPGDNIPRRRPKTVASTQAIFKPSGTAHFFRGEKTGY